MFACNGLLWVIDGGDIRWNNSHPMMNTSHRQTIDPVHTEQFLRKQIEMATVQQVPHAVRQSIELFLQGMRIGEGPNGAHDSAMRLSRACKELNEGMSPDFPESLSDAISWLCLAAKSRLAPFLETELGASYAECIHLQRAEKRE